MKKCILLITISLHAGGVLIAQNVGIGTTTPLEKLSILTDFGYGVSHEANSIKLSTYIDGGGAYLGTVSNNPFHLFTNNGTAEVSLGTNGFLGLGNGFPQYRLDMLGRMRIRTGSVGNIFTTSGIWMDDYRDGSTRIFLGMQDSIRLGIWGDGTPGAAWAFNFNARDGRVGIGRVAGNYQLEIAADYGIGLFKNSGNSYFGSLGSNADTALVISAAYGSVFGGSVAKNILLNPSPGFPLYSGNVAIGTASPNAKLHVNGNVLIGAGSPALGYALSIKGKVICTEAKVQLVSGWPDYVLKEDFKLLPIYELEKQIKVLGHLPNIPSAEEIEKNGMELGDMVKRLMEKVEELTLYVIELKKENEKLKNKQ